MSSSGYNIILKYLLQQKVKHTDVIKQVEQVTMLLCATTRLVEDMSTQCICTCLGLIRLFLGVLVNGLRLLIHEDTRLEKKVKQVVRLQSIIILSFVIR